MKKNILKEAAQETVANCSANDLKRILGGEPERNEAGELDYFTENSINPKLRRAHPDLFFDIKYLRIFPKADKNTYYDEQGQGDPDDNKWAWQIYVTTLNDTTSDNTRAVVRIKDFIQGSIGNQINEVKRLQKIAGILKENTNEVRMWFNKDGDYVPYRPEDDTAPDYDEDEDELPPINKAELVSFIRKAGPKQVAPAPKGPYNVTLYYYDHPSIPDSYMTGARDVFMCVVKACGGKAKLEGRPGPEQNYTVVGCSFETLQAVWKFLASDQTYETAGDSDTIVQANGCATTWQLNSDYDQQDSTQDADYDPRYDSSVPE